MCFCVKEGETDAGGEYVYLFFHMENSLMSWPEL